MSDVTITVNVGGDGRLPDVSPETSATDADGKADFRFRFPFRSENGVITFIANGETVTIKQE